MELASLIISSISLILVIILLILYVKQKSNNVLSSSDLEQIKKSILDSSKDGNELFIEKIKVNLDAQSNVIKEKNDSLFSSLNIRLDNFEKEIESNKVAIESIKKENQEFYSRVIKESNESNEKIISQLSLAVKELKLDLEKTLDKLEGTVKENLTQIRNDSNDKLDKINVTVSEKLEKTLEGKLKESFDNVVSQIGSVNKAIGEIKGLANDVGSLKTVLTNVKTKGIVGEVILGNIIKDILTVSQYDENVVTKVGSSERVEFAIKMPGQGDEFIYLPIDSKLPLEDYHKIKEGMEKGNPDLIKEGRTKLRQSIRKYAKDISDKYIDVPNTTDFGIMFLPIEGLYIEALDMGLFEEIQKEFRVNLAGPTTLTAILNALQMGFKTLVIQKKSADVFKLLGAVKTEFAKFADTLDKAQKKVNAASDELDNLVGARTKKIRTKLNQIESLSEVETRELLDSEN
jgi:DNA recombination protein RmuC